MPRLVDFMSSNRFTFVALLCSILTLFIVVNLMIEAFHFSQLIWLAWTVCMAAIILMFLVEEYGVDIKSIKKFRTIRVILFVLGFSLIGIHIAFF